MKKLMLAAALVAVAAPSFAAVGAKPAGLLVKAAPILVTTAVVGGAIAAANNGNSGNTSGTN